MSTVEYRPVIGMEIHVELKTRSKMFCGCVNDPFHAPAPNTYTCPVCLGMPGGLPVPNRKAVEWTILLGLALGCTISKHSKFDRKNYFYPDLPKGYQISQYDQPLCTDGNVHLTGGDVRIHRVHLEEDTGKLQHAKVDGETVTLVDYNRSGVPLVEIVTEPDITSGDHAKAFLKHLHQIVTDLDISDAEMDKGTMRLEPNISVRTIKRGMSAEEKETLPPYKVEVKNINSFTFVKKAIEFEVDRHTEILKTGSYPKQETRGWDEDTNSTFAQRSKEEAQDYRYFPEPDIPPMEFSDEYLDELSRRLAAMDVYEDRVKYLSDGGVKASDATFIASDRELYRFVREAHELAAAHATKSMQVSLQDIANYLKNRQGDVHATSPQAVVDEIASARVFTVGRDAIQQAVTEVIAANPKAVADFKSGKEGAIMFLLGQVVRVVRGNADKALILEVLRGQLN